MQRNKRQFSVTQIHADQLHFWWKIQVGILCFHVGADFHTWAHFPQVIAEPVFTGGDGLNGMRATRGQAKRGAGKTAEPSCVARSKGRGGACRDGWWWAKTVAKSGV
jgi:hypothetical protein